MHTRLVFLAVCLVGTLSFIGCGAKEKPYTPAEAETKLIAFCDKEGGVAITTRAIGKTQWVYLPMEEPLFEMKPSRDDGRKPERKPAPFALLSLDTAFTPEKTFAVTYDIVPDVLPGDAPGYGMNYNEDFTKKKQLIYQGLQETFFNLKEPDAPLFFVVVIADITKGLAMKSTFYLQDLKELMTGAIYEEYYFRELPDIIGNEKLVGDKTGQALVYSDVSWSAFLTSQIKNRIRFKFTQSDFKPQTAPDEEIITLAANALKIYPFSDYTGLHLYNRRDKKERLLTKDELTALATGPGREEQKGKTTVIHYSLKDGIQ